MTRPTRPSGKNGRGGNGKSNGHKKRVSGKDNYNSDREQREQRKEKRRQRNREKEKSCKVSPTPPAGMASGHNNAILFCQLLSVNFFVAFDIRNTFLKVVRKNPGHYRTNISIALSSEGSSAFSTESWLFEQLHIFCFVGFNMFGL